MGGMEGGRGRAKWGVAGCKMVISEMSLDKYGDIGWWGIEGVGHKGREEGREFGSTGYRNIRLSIRKTKCKPCLTEASLWGLKCYLV